jgi:hypothetical protein
MTATQCRLSAGAIGPFFQLRAKHFQIWGAIRQTFPKISLAVLSEIRGLQGGGKEISAVRQAFAPPPPPCFGSVRRHDVNDAECSITQSAHMNSDFQK